MRRPLSALWWLIFIPYFSIKSLNSRPFFTDDREYANRVNGLVGVTLISQFLVMAALSFTNLAYLLSSMAFLLGTYALGCVAAVALVSRKREGVYYPLYRAMPPTKRRVLGVVVLVAFVAVLVVSTLSVGKRPAPTRSPSCPSTATEMTAECS